MLLMYCSDAMMRCDLISCDGESITVARCFNGTNNYGMNIGSNDPIQHGMGGCGADGIGFIRT